MHPAPTIAAISTALGVGAIGIVRLTGSESIDICDRLFRGKQPLNQAASHTMNYGVIYDPTSGTTVDEVLVAVMRGPKTYTCEDVVEINCHGGAVVLQRLLSLLLEHGAELATPGEFTRRAFLNGRIDLTQAESVAQIVAAKTSAGLKVALGQLQGALGEAIRDNRRQLLKVLATLEAELDFSDQDIENADRSAVMEALLVSEASLRQLLESAFIGRVLSQGVRTAIVGKPNVGKSSLLNALLMRERAIVTEIPGTTRDTIEEVINIRGIPLLLIDTAGVRPAADAVERIGVERSRAAIAAADLILCLVDGSQPEDDHDRALLNSLPAEKTIYVMNKADSWRGSQPRFNRALLPPEAVIISAATRQGLPRLKEVIAATVVGGSMPPLEGPIISQERHKQLLEKTLKSLELARQGLRVNLGAELVAEELRAALSHLGEITGEELVEDLLDVIFQEFCIGK